MFNVRTSVALSLLFSHYQKGMETVYEFILAPFTDVVINKGTIQPTYGLQPMAQKRQF